MRFRPCIDIHDGAVKQIVGGSLRDEQALENYISDKDAGYYAGMYKADGLKGGHIIILNKKGTAEYEASKEQSLRALSAYPGGMQIGGGMDDECAAAFLDAGASHVIVTSFAFRDGSVQEDNLKKLVKAVGREHIVLDLSCRRVDMDYYIATDRWQKLTKVKVDEKALEYFAGFCDEFLIHAVDVEGKQGGIEEDIVRLMGNASPIAATYAGGVRNLADLDSIRRLGENRVDVTIGSALDIFGGPLSYRKVVEYTK